MKNGRKPPACRLKRFTEIEKEAMFIIAIKRVVTPRSCGLIGQAWGNTPVVYGTVPKGGLHAIFSVTLHDVENRHRPFKAFLSHASTQTAR